MSSPVEIPVGANGCKHVPVASFELGFVSVAINFAGGLIVRKVGISLKRLAGTSEGIIRARQLLSHGEKKLLNDNTRRGDSSLPIYYQGKCQAA